MVILVFFDILQLPHTVISNSEKLTHPTAHSVLSTVCLWLLQDDRPYLCPYCSKSFKTNVHCKKHIKTHRQNRPGATSNKTNKNAKEKKSLLVSQVRDILRYIFI